MGGIPPLYVEIFSLVIQPDAKIVLGGSSPQLARLNTSGTLDTAFHTNAELYHRVNVNSLGLQPDGKIIAGRLYGIDRRNVDGTPDPSFDPTSVEETTIVTIALQPDGKIIAGGAINPGMNFRTIVRHNANGALDTTFNLAGLLYGEVSCIALRPDGKIIVGGYRQRPNGLAQRNISCLNTDGTINMGFDPGSGFGGDSLSRYSGLIHCLVLQPDGKIVVGGSFNSYNGIACNNIARLNEDGTLDTTFKSGSGFTYTNNTTYSDLGIVYSLALQPDGKIIAGGNFTSYNSTPRNGIARLNNASGAVNIKERGTTATLTLSPNPAHQTVTITSTQPVKAIRLSNTAGQQVRTQAGASETLDVSALPPGLYLLEAEMVTGPPVRRRLVVE